MDYTSVDQSKRLLEAGLNKDSADMHFIIQNDCNGRAYPILDFGKCKEYDIPSWSLSALWKEVSKVGKFAFQETDSPEDIIESLVKLYEEYKNRKK